MTIFGISDKQFNPVLEKYVGNNRKEFKIIESELKKMIDFIKEKDNGLLLDISSSDLNNSSHNKLIEKMFKEIFDLKEMTIVWETNATPNAFTLVKTFILFDRQIKDNGYKGKTNNTMKVNVFLNTGLVTSANLNEKEITAIILHEIGHNFYNSIFQLLTVLAIDLRNVDLSQITSASYRDWETDRKSVV